MSSIAGNERDIVLAANAIARQIEELRDSGFTVEVVEDHRVIAVVKVTRQDGDSTKMVLDPLQIISRLRKLTKLTMN